MYQIWSTIKSILSLLVIVCTYGMVGRIDFDDAVMMEDAQKQAIQPGCAATNSVWSTRPIHTQPAASAALTDEPEISPADPGNALVY